MGVILEAKLAAQRPVRKNFHVVLYFSRSFYFNIDPSISILSYWGQELGGSEKTGSGPYIQEHRLSQKTRSSLSRWAKNAIDTLSWDEFRKIPRIKLHSKHMKCSLIIYCFSETSARIFIIRFGFLSKWERILIWNYIFGSISTRCSSDNLRKPFFPPLLFSFLIREHCPLEITLLLSLFIFPLYFSSL